MNIFFITYANKFPKRARRKNCLVDNSWWDLRRRQAAGFLRLFAHHRVIQWACSYMPSLTLSHSLVGGVMVHKILRSSFIKREEIELIMQHTIYFRWLSFPLVFQFLDYATLIDAAFVRRLTSNNLEWSEEAHVWHDWDGETIWLYGENTRLSPSILLLLGR